MLQVFSESLAEDNHVVDVNADEISIAASYVFDYSLCIRWGVLESHDSDTKAFHTSMRYNCKLVAILFCNRKLVKETESINDGNVFATCNCCDNVCLIWNGIGIRNCDLVEVTDIYNGTSFANELAV